MSGIAGILTPCYAVGTAEALQRAAELLRHRGPDDDGLATWPAEPVPGRPFTALACRRLAIVDLSSAVHQPMVTADGRYTLVLDGEIYNHPELRGELEALGHRFRSRSDSEVLLEGFARWGRGVLSRVVGMFAFAVYDAEQRRIFLARDPFGIKPLYYARAGGGVVFASEMDVLLEQPGVSRRVNPQRLYDFLDRGDTDEAAETLFADVRQLEPAHSLELPLDDPGSAVPARYWAADLTGQVDLSFEEAAARLRDLFLDSVRLHLRSDVPVGVALSGGIDSSSVLLAMRRLLGPAADLQAFTYATEDADITEGPYPGIAARAAGARLTAATVAPEELRAAYPGLQRLQGEPIHGPTIYAQHQVFGLARASGVKVILEGQGSDEMLAGYDTYMTGRVATLIRRGLWAAARDFFARYPAGGAARRGLGVGVLRQVLPAAWVRSLMRFRRGRRMRAAALDPDWFARRGVAAAGPWRFEGDWVMRQMLHDTLMRNPIQALLRCGDRNAMAFSLENRVPFLTTALVEFVYALPEEYIIDRHGRRKAVFRQAMRGLVPDAILDRRDKIGFATPVARWLLAVRPWAEERLRTVEQLPGLEPAGVRARWRAVQERRRPGDAIQVWRWISLGLWAEQRGVRFE